MVNFKEIFRKNVTYGNIKSHRKLGLHPPSRKHNFGKTAKGGVGVGHWVNIISRLIAFMSSFVMVASRAFVTTNSYFWFVFYCIRTRNTSVFGHFSRSNTFNFVMFSIRNTGNIPKFTDYFFSEMF